MVVQSLVVEETLRSAGIGRMLMERIERDPPVQELRHGRALFPASPATTLASFTSVSGNL